MAEQATASAETKQKAAGNGAAPAAGRGYKTISKLEAVRRSLEKLGREATNAEIQADVLERFGVEMSTNHVSTCKGDLRKKAKAKKPVAAPAANVQTAKPASKTQTARPAVRREQAATPSAATPHSGESNGRKTAVELDDILAVKALVDRVGAGHLRTLIDVMAK